MSTPERKPRIDRERTELLERLREATELLEQVAADRALLAALPSEERRRLMQAAGTVFHPEPSERRRLIKTIERLRRVDKAERDDQLLAGTGIRTLRRQTVFTTPRAFAPTTFEPHDLPPGESDETAARAAAEVSAAPAAAEPPAARLQRTWESTPFGNSRLCRTTTARNTEW